MIPKTQIFLLWGAKWESDRSAMLEAAGEDVLEFALAMGRKITGRTIESDPTVVTDQAAEALALVVAPSAVTISINPKDRSLMKRAMGRLLEKIDGCSHVELRDDPAVSRGGCIVTTARGRIDATIDRQIDRIVQTLLARQPGERS